MPQPTPMPQPKPLTARIRSGVAGVLLGWIVLAGPGPASAAGQPYLLELSGESVTIHYSPGSLDRAAHAQIRFELLVRDFQQWTRKGVPLDLWILDREAWEGLDLVRPYGLPARIGDVVALAAAGDDGTVALWRGLIGDALPTSATGSGMALQSTPAEVGSLAMNDLMGELAVARLLVDRSGMRGETVWIENLIVHVVATTAFVRHEKGRMEEIGLVFDRLQSLRGGTLEVSADGPPQALPLDTWLAYQGRYSAAARLIVQKDDLLAVKKLFKMTRKGDQPLTWSALVERYPELSAWLEDSFRLVQ